MVNYALYWHHGFGALSQEHQEPYADSVPGWLQDYLQAEMPDKNHRKKDRMSLSAPPQPVFRRAVPADSGIIAAITNAAYTKYIARMGREPQPMTADYDQILATHPVWLLCRADEPVGVLVLMHEPETMLIYSVAIGPPYQKHGYGRRLLAWAEEQAQQAGYTSIRLFTNGLMTENIALYQRLGYSETGREPFNGLTIVHMAKRLSPGD